MKKENSLKEKKEIFQILLLIGIIGIYGNCLESRNLANVAIFSCVVVFSAVKLWMLNLETKKHLRYQIRLRESGIKIGGSNTESVAIQMVEELIREDRSLKDYKQDVYEIYDTLREEVVWLEVK